MSDLIERDKAINILDVIDVDIIPYADTREYVQSAIDYIRKELEELPSARPKGEWIVERLDNYKKIKYTCPFCEWCGIDNYDSYVDVIDFDFCPRCGADMREREGE